MWPYPHDADGHRPEPHALDGLPSAILPVERGMPEVDAVKELRSMLIFKA